MKCEQTRSARPEGSNPPNRCIDVKTKKRHRQVAFSLGFTDASDSYDRRSYVQKYQMATLGARFSLIGNLRTGLFSQVTVGLGSRINPKLLPSDNNRTMATSLTAGVGAKLSFGRTISPYIRGGMFIGPLFIKNDATRGHGWWNAALGLSFPIGSNGLRINWDLLNLGIMAMFGVSKTRSVTIRGERFILPNYEKRYFYSLGTQLSIQTNY